MTFSPTFHAVLAQSILMRRRQDTWDPLQSEMSSKRVKAADAMSGARKKKGSAPNEIIVQRLASEPDSKQTYRPVQPREFVVEPATNYSTVDVKMTSKVEPAVDYSTVDRKNLGTRL